MTYCMRGGDNIMAMKVRDFAEGADQICDKYPFKRMFYFRLLKFIKMSFNSFCALLGPRKSGKTVALLQLQEYLNKVNTLTYYVNIKDCDLNKDDLWDNLLDVIYSRKYKVVIIDEFTRLPSYDVFLQGLYDIAQTQDIKFIITGSASLYVRKSCGLVVRDNVDYVQSNFLTFTEHLMYKGKLLSYAKRDFSDTSLIETIETFKENIYWEDYYDYVKNAYKFVQIYDIKEYLHSCLDEIVYSNTVRNLTDISIAEGDVDIEVTIALLYFSLYNLHKGYNWNSLQRVDDFDMGSEYLTMRDSLEKRSESIKKSKFTKVVEDTIIYDKIQPLRGADENTVRKSLYFLLECDLILFQFKNISVTRDSLISWLCGNNTALSDKLQISKAKDIFNHADILIKSPTAFTPLIEDLIKCLAIKGYDNITVDDILDGSTYGSLLETFVKGAYSDAINKCIIQEFRQNDTEEIDIVDVQNRLLIEIGKNDKKLKDTHFDSYDGNENFVKILVGEQKCLPLDYDMYRVSYPVFVIWLDGIYYNNLMR